MRDVVCFAKLVCAASFFGAADINHVYTCLNLLDVWSARLFCSLQTAIDKRGAFEEKLPPLIEQR